MNKVLPAGERNIAFDPQPKRAEVNRLYGNNSLCRCNIVTLCVLLGKPLTLRICTATSAVNEILRQPQSLLAPYFFINQRWRHFSVHRRQDIFYCN